MASNSKEKSANSNTNNNDNDNDDANKKVGTRYARRPVSWPIVATT